MPNDTITFQCPSCGIKLTVPGSLAGVTGPCPNCRNSIQAPFPTPAPVNPAFPSPGYPQGPAPAYQPPAPEPPPQQAPAQAYQPPAYPAPETQTPVSQPQTPAYQPQVPVSQPQAPAYQPQAPVSQPQAPAYQPQAPVSQPQAPAYQPQAPVSQPQAPAYQPQAPVSQPQAPAYPPQAPVSEPQAPAYPPQVQAYQPPAPAYQPEPAYQPQPTPPSSYPAEPIVYPAAPPAYPPQQPQIPAGYEPPPLPSPSFEQQPPVLLVPEPAVTPSASPALVRPEPRQLPQRSSGEPVAKQMPEPTPGSSSSKRGNPLPRHPHRKGPFARFMLLFLFLIASVALVFGVLTVLNNQAKDPVPAKPLLPPAAAPAGPEIPAPGSTAPEKPPEPTGQKPPVLPVPQPEQPAIVEPPPELPEGIEPVTPSSQAREVLDKFLAAKTLAERLPMIETKTAQAELEASCLARPLPSWDKIYIETQENNPMEQVSDFYHSIDFIGENNKLNPHIILVRIRGASTPKVVVDPFLDSYGGRLAAYAKAPVDQAGVFQITVSALASCYNENVPNREKKLTLKLLPRDNEKAIAEAYFGRQSEIGRILEEGTYSLRYGMTKACTVMLRWNKEDNPEKPYLEAIKLNRQDWNP